MTPFTSALCAAAFYHLASCAGLSMSLSVDERLEVLLHIKWTVKQFDCQLTREICELVDREADLLNRGRSEKSLDGAFGDHNPGCSVSPLS